MKKTTKKTNQGHACEASKMESLPSELMMDILSRVPTLELGNLRCVCKRWREIVRVKDPLFRALHSSHSMSESTDNTIVLLKGFDDDLCFVDLAPSHRQGDEVTIKPIDTSYVDVCSFSRYHVIGSCNGVLCLGSRSNMDILVMNPITRQHVRLDMGFSAGIWSWGFGFEPLKKMYKVVVVVWDSYFLTSELSICICDLDSEWSWEWRHIGSEDTFDFRESPACFVNGRLHWTHDDFSSSVSIVSFDLTDEEFRLIQTPDCLRHTDEFDLFVLRGCLYIIRYYFSKPQTWEITRRSEIWVMKEYGVKESWVKVFDMKPLISRSLPSHFNRSQKKRWRRLILEGLGSITGGIVLLKCEWRGSKKEILFSSYPTCDQFQILEFESASFFKESVIHTASLNWI